MCMFLMFSLLTLNVFMTSLAPEYMAFGYQTYVRRGPGAVRPPGGG